jgi:hypothetical protein
MTPFVNKDGNEPNRLGHECVPSDDGHDGVGNVQQNEQRLRIVATGPSGEIVAAIIIVIIVFLFHEA